MPRRGKLYKYLLPSWDDIRDVYLAAFSIAGYMWSGKSVLTRKIAATCERYVCEQKRSFLYVEGRRQRDVLEYFEDNRDVLRGLDYLFVSYDDAGRYYLSRESTTRERREEIKDFLEIRHKFEELGFKRGVLAISFNIQRFELLDKTIRSSPVTIFKTIVSHDPRDLRMLARLLGRRRFKFLKAITAKMYFNTLPKDPEVIEVFNQLGIDPKSLDRNSVKRFAVVLYVDGSRKIVDFGPGLSVPKNCVKVETSENDVDFEDPPPEAKCYIAYFLAKHLILEGYGVRGALEEVRSLGLRIRTQTFIELYKLAQEKVLSV